MDPSNTPRQPMPNMRPVVRDLIERLENDSSFTPDEAAALLNANGFNTKPHIIKLYLATMDESRHSKPNAIFLLRVAHVLDPEDTRVMATLVDFLIEDRAFFEALELVGKIRNRNDRWIVSIRERIGRGLVEGGRPHEAVVAAKDCNTPYGRGIYAQALVAIGVANQDRAAILSALSALGEIPNIEGNEPMLWLRAKCNALLGEREECIRILCTLITIQPRANYLAALIAMEPGEAILDAAESRVNRHC